VKTVVVDPRSSVDPSASMLALERRPWSDVELPAEVLRAPSMLSQSERRALYVLARDYFQGAGRIVDAGCFLGGSTIALAAGLRDRAQEPENSAIVSYDLFRVEPYTLEHFRDDLPSTSTGDSFRPAFDANLSGFPGRYDVREGDIREIGWSGEPIEILFLDIVKTWEISDSVLSDFFPHLIPGRSVLVQQDCLWGTHPWLQVTMEILREYFACVDWIDGSAIYLHTGAIPDEVLRVCMKDATPPETKLQMMDRAVERWSGEARAMAELSRASLLLELVGAGAAREQIGRVRREHPDATLVQVCATEIETRMGEVGA
jgi:hypothetical protein